MQKKLFTTLCLCFFLTTIIAQPRFHALVLFENGGHHLAFTNAAQPCMKNLPLQFTISKEEWYTYNKSPRDDVHVLASVNESTYVPNSNIKMGDHPVVWTNEHFPARNIYIFMGHGPDLLENRFYTIFLTNAIFWTSG